MNNEPKPIQHFVDKAISKLDSPIRWNKKLQKIKFAIDQQIYHAPHIDVIYLKPADYNALVDSIAPEHRRYIDVRKLFYRQKIIKSG